MIRKRPQSTPTTLPAMSAFIRFKFTLPFSRPRSGICASDEPVKDLQAVKTTSCHQLCFLSFRSLAVLLHARATSLLTWQTDSLNRAAQLPTGGATCHSARKGTRTFPWKPVTKVFICSVKEQSGRQKSPVEKAKQPPVLWCVLYKIFTSQPLMDISHVNGCLETYMHHSDTPMESASRATVGINSAAAAAAPELA